MIFEITVVSPVNSCSPTMRPSTGTKLTVAHTSPSADTAATMPSSSIKHPLRELARQRSADDGGKSSPTRVKRMVFTTDLRRGTPRCA
jgi:hypothetical protein